MLRVTVRKSAEGLIEYSRNALAKDDYYSEGQEVAGAWGGKAAKRLGLEGKIDQVEFDRLCNNLHPTLSDRRLTLRTNKKNRTVAEDWNFNPPKDVSLLHVFTGDSRIVTAVREAAGETMDAVEAFVETRVRRNGVEDGNRRTGNFIRAEYVHLRARPVDGIPDPHLHIHYIVFNVTYDEADGCFKAIHFRAMREAASFQEARFHNLLAHKLQALGYQTEARGKSFGIIGVPESANRKFSRRTTLIEREKLRRGITDPDKASMLGALTREGKRENLTREELRAADFARLSPEERTAFEQLARIQKRHLRTEQRRSDGAAQTHEEYLLEHPPQSSKQTQGLRVALGTRQDLLNAQRSPSKITEQDAITYALKHHFLKASVVKRSQFLETAVRFGVGQLHIGPLEAEFQRRVEAGDIIMREARYGQMVTTREVLAEEQYALQWIKQKAPALAPGHVIVDTRLSNEQRAAVRHVISSTERLIGVVGLAGTGKTTLMHEAIRAIQSNSRKVMVLTPHSEHAYDRLRPDGFQNAMTVDGFLINEALQEQCRDGVIWTDEAGLLSSRVAYRLLKVAEQLNAHVIISGDPRQHGPVARGDFMRMLENIGGMDFAALEQIQRQKGINRVVVEHFANRRIVEGFELLDQMGRVHELDEEHRYKEAAREYLQCLEDGKSVLLTSPTHREGEKLEMEVRHQRKERGQLQDERPVNILRRVNLDEAQRADWRNFRSGWVIEVNQNVKDFRKRQRLEIAAVGEPTIGGFLVRGTDGAEVAFDVRKYAERFEAYEKDVLGIAVGERIRISNGGKSVDGRQRFTNGSIHTVTGFTQDGDLETAKGVLSREYGHLCWGNCSTSHVAQGKTVDVVIVVQSAESFRASNQEQAYTSISRGREAKWYLDDKEEVLDAIHATSARTSAVELLQDEMQLAVSPHFGVTSQDHASSMKHNEPKRKGVNELLPIRRTAQHEMVL